MRVPHVRFTIRRMMVAVAVVALLTTMGMAVSPELSRRWRACQAAAARQEGMARMAMGRMPGALSRQKAALHREASRRNRWAFFDPFHECILDQDIY